ncbi:MAG TPA: TonB-dependent receptor plug domain-containing protein [Opitutus sp.]|nr:TonB-dependent receptor plug domain-containing protein [Opitutus sp.]
MKTKIPRRFALALALAPGLAASLPAQTTPAPDTTDTSQEQPVVLQTFTVNTDRDRGYIAVDALAGGRTNTPIKLTPASMSSLTRTFLDDLGIQNVREALQWSPNVVPTDPLAGKGFGGQAFHAWSFNYRGAGAGQQGGPGPTKNYFSFYQDADAYNVERIEFTRGPNSILFGIGTVGGTLTTYTKVPRLDRSFISPAVIVDDNGSRRFEADYNIAVNDKFAVRINGLYDENRGWRENDKTNRRAIDVALLYKFTDNTSFRLEVEGSKIRKTLISSNIGDKISGWDGVTASQTWGAAPTGGSARTIPIQNAGAWGDWLNPFWVYIPTLEGKTLMPWAGGYASSGALADVGSALNWAPYRGWYPDQIKLPWETTYSSTANIPLRPSQDWTYGHGVSDIKFGDVTAFLDHRFNEHLDAQLGFYRYSDWQVAKDYEGTGGAAIDINKQLPDGTANPNFGKPFADFFLSKQTQGRDVTEGRAQINYNYDGTLFGSPWKQLFSVSAARKILKISARQYLGQVNTPISAPGDWVQRMVWGRLYLDKPNQLMNIPSSINGLPIAYMPKLDGYWFDFDDRFELTDYAFVSHSRLFDDRLSVLLGARHDSYDERVVSLRRGPNLTDDIANESKTGTTYSAGAVYYFGWLGVFANYSENQQPPNAGSQPYLNGSRPDPEEGKGVDYGFRISTGDGKYYATLSRYDTKSSGRNVENPVDIRGLWQRYNVAVGNPQDSGFGGVAYSDTTSLKVTGYEFELTANPLSNLRVQASYALPDTEVVDFYPAVRAHVAENLATWQNAITATTDPQKKSDLQNALASVQDKLAQSVAGAPEQGSVDYTASFFVNYTFLHDALKGWSVGGGGSFTGKSYQATYNGMDHYGDSSRTFDAVIAYETHFGNVRARFALNVDNIFDYDNPIVTGYHWGYADQSGRHIRDAYYYQTPRTFRLSARFTF